MGNEADIEDSYNYLGIRQETMAKEATKESSNHQIVVHKQRKNSVVIHVTTLLSNDIFLLSNLSFIIQSTLSKLCVLVLQLNNHLISSVHPVTDM